MKKTILFIVTSLFLYNCEENTPKYKDASQPVETRVKDLLNRMTLEEKLSQINP